MPPFVAGVMCAGYLVAALFFFRFWSETRDRLFGMFGLAFAVLGANRMLLTLIGDGHEARTGLYVVRLLAFLLILAAILDKNRASAG